MMCSENIEKAHTFKSDWEAKEKVFGGMENEGFIEPRSICELMKKKTWMKAQAWRNKIAFSEKLE